MSEGLSVTEIKYFIEELSASLNFFPSKPGFERALIKFIGGMIGGKMIVEWTPQARLSWLVMELVNKVGRWPEGGFREVRGIYCTKFNPADGLEADCFTPGYVASKAPASKYLLQPGDLPLGQDIECKLTEVVLRKRAK